MSKAKGSMRAGKFFSRGMGLVLAGLLASPFVAEGWAQPSQPAMCSTIRGELANLQRDAPPSGNPREAARLRGELANVRNAIRANNCDQRGFFGFGGPPPVCAPLRAQAQQFEARLRQVEPIDANSPRRAQLLAAYQRYGCDGNQPQQRGVIYAQPQGGLFDRLFGPGGAGEQRRESFVEIDSELDDELKEKARLGGRTPVCVRTCDGFFFPVNFEGLTARDEHGKVCQALCPASETIVMYMRLGADIETAATREGQAYTAFPFALKYRESRDSACFCRPPGYTVAQLAKGQEDYVETRKGDLVVTREQAEALSRPKEVRGQGQQRPQANARTPRPATPAPEEPAPVPESAIPTAGTASAGIGPRLGNERVLGGAQGQMQEVVGADGVRRQVRVVAPAPNAPEPQPALRGAARPSTQAPARAP